jgi:antitoxin ChpS
MTTSTLRNVGGSVMMTIPKPLLDGLGLAANEKVTLHIVDGKLVVEPRSRPRYTLAALLAEGTPVQDQDWDEAPATGREEI